MVPTVGAIVLASGISTRFGDQDKLTMPYRGTPMLRWVLDALPQPLFARRLVIARSAAVANLAREAGFEVLLHDLSDVSDTIRLGTQAMADMDGCLYAVGDQPLLTACTVQRVVDMFLADPNRIVRAGKDGRVGNPALFPARFFGELCSLPKGHGGNYIIHRYPQQLNVAQAAFALELYDVDTQADYDKLEG